MKQLLLGYLPAEKDLWEGELANNRLRYAELKRELLLNPVKSLLVDFLYFQSEAEADSFECFVQLLSGSVDHFCQQLDNSSVGIHSTLLHFSELLKANDGELWRHLDASKVC
ncbi:hypothetical protein B296_00019001 [Ensete ventricosum]|uniref:Rab-GAP TBC domain-containing protein n=1 Tax=Ensete ventricosum TaxID=4639 RepID=A0A426YUI0_ENSVE|nr:hypothetical protein B296_00019001 [Ensete ventricosum]